MGLNFTHTGDTTEVVAYVSPNKARFFTLSAEHFFGVGDIYIDVRTVPIVQLSLVVEWNVCPEYKECVVISNTREFKITTTATATGTSLNKRLNEQNNGSARAL